jgi:uncharacterized membrane protein
MLVLMILLRLIHIVAGVLWVGAGIFYFLFVVPTVKGLGPAGPKFMQDLVTKRRYPTFMNVSSGLTILAGLLLFWIVSGGLSMAWITSGPGLGFTIGSLAALAAYGVGFFGIRPRVERMNALGQAIAAAGGPPTPEQAAELGRLEKEMHTVERWDMILLMLSLVTMATARYWHF